MNSAFLQGHEGNFTQFRYAGENDCVSLYSQDLTSLLTGDDFKHHTFPFVLALGSAALIVMEAHSMVSFNSILVNPVICNNFRTCMTLSTVPFKLLAASQLLCAPEVI